MKLRELSGKKILLAASQPPKAGPPDGQQRFASAVTALCVGLVQKGATIVYGGNLSSNGLTSQIELSLSHIDPQQGARTFIHVLDEPSLIETGFKQLRATLQRRKNSAISTYACVGDAYGELSVIDGKTVEFGGFGSEPEIYLAETFPRIVSLATSAAAFTIARLQKIADADACIAIGGKTGILTDPSDRYFGNFPGVAEEALGVLQNGKPVIAIGRYGGCARSIAQALNLFDPPRDEPGPRQPGFATMMAALTSASGRIPRNLQSDLSNIAKLGITPELIDLVSSVILNWKEPAPRKSYGRDGAGFKPGF